MVTNLVKVSIGKKSNAKSVSRGERKKFRTVSKVREASAFSFKIPCISGRGSSWRVIQPSVPDLKSFERDDIQSLNVCTFAFTRRHAWNEYLVPNPAIPRRRRIYFISLSLFLREATCFFVRASKDSLPSLSCATPAVLFFVNSLTTPPGGEGSRRGARG